MTAAPGTRHPAPDGRDSLVALCGAAKEAALALAAVPGRRRAAALEAAAAALEAAAPSIIAANAADLAAARERGLSAALIDRLALNDARIAAMAKGVREVAALPDPLARRLATIRRPNGLVIEKRPVPIGVIAVIFESRPNVAADAAALCVKSGNAAILRGGKEALATNCAIVDAMTTALEVAGIPAGAVQLIRDTDHALVAELVRQEGLVDLVIPRGGERLVRAVMENARIPVLKHYNGICHIYVDKDADQAQALEIIRNAKCQRPGTCNAVEKVLVHEAIAAEFVPELAKACAKWGVEVFADEFARSLVPALAAATEEDWTAEYLDLKLTLGVVPSVQAAIDHINHYGSHHSDAILTRDGTAARRFLARVDSAAVYHNASTRFTDGGEFGFGCEMGISTDKLHARGPVGIRELTTYKYVVKGSGQTRG